MVNIHHLVAISEHEKCGGRENMSREELIRSIIEELAQQDLSGPEWDDYDENGIPCWAKYRDWETMQQ